jgi:hypothetical protein
MVQTHAMLQLEGMPSHAHWQLHCITGQHSMQQTFDLMATTSELIACPVRTRKRASDVDSTLSQQKDKVHEWCKSS